MRLLNELSRALLDAGSMTWQITWSLILGFTLSAVIQAVGGREAIARHLGDSSTRTLALATGLGAACASCSYATIVAGGYIIEFTLGGLGLVPADRAAKVTGTGITWNYTTILNIIFLLAAAALLVRFARSGSTAMLKMMGGSPAQPQSTHNHSEVLPHRDTQPAQQTLQTQIRDHQNEIALPSTGIAPAPTVRSRD